MSEQHMMAAPGDLAPRHRDFAAGGWRRVLITALTALMSGTFAYLLWSIWPAFEGLAQIGPARLLLGMSFLLAFIPLCICLVQNVTRSRQLRRLDSLRAFPVSKTSYFAAARMAVDQVRTVSVDSDYLVPMVVYAIVLTVGFTFISLGLALPHVLETPYTLLGGWEAGSAVLGLPESAEKLRLYQAETFTVAAAAFLGSYVYAISRLLDRVNNNDLYPISLYYYAARVLIAVFVAVVVRQTCTYFSLEGSLLILIGFVIGLAPDMFLVAMSRRAFQAFKVWGVRDDPGGTKPASLPLLMIDDLSRDKIDRLTELGIDSAQVLARQNPFLLWPRLPYELTLIVDWIGQAQLYALVRYDSLAAVRARYVRDNFDLEDRLGDPATRPAICQALGIEAGEAEAMLHHLASDPSHIRLKQVRAALATC